MRDLVVHTVADSRTYKRFPILQRLAEPHDKHVVCRDLLVVGLFDVLIEVIDYDLFCSIEHCIIAHPVCPPMFLPS